MIQISGKQKSSWLAGSLIKINSRQIKRFKPNQRRGGGGGRGGEKKEDRRETWEGKAIKALEENMGKKRCMNLEWRQLYKQDTEFSRYKNYYT